MKTQNDIDKENIERAKLRQALARVYGDIAREDRLSQTFFGRIKLWIEHVFETIAIVLGVTFVLIVSNWFSITVVALLIYAISKLP